MSNLTIYNTSVKLESQEQLNRLLDACEGKGFKVERNNEFDLISDYFYHSNYFKEFANWINTYSSTPITEQEFLTLLEEI